MHGMQQDQSDRTRSRRTLRPFRATAPNKIGRWMLGATLTTGAVCVLGAGATGRASREVAGGFEPGGVFMILAVLAAAAFLLLTLGWRLPGIERLYLKPLPLAVVSDEGLELHIPSAGVFLVRWDETTGLSRGQNGRGSLRAKTGEELVQVPSSLMSDGRRTLAQLVVEVRGDMFILERSRPFSPPKYFTSRQTSASHAGP